LDNAERIDFCLFEVYLCDEVVSSGGRVHRLDVQGWLTRGVERRHRPEDGALAVSKGKMRLGQFCLPGINIEIIIE